MWPFKKKEKRWKPKSDIDYLMLGLMQQVKFRKALRNLERKKPTYTPSKIIQPKQ